MIENFDADFKKYKSTEFINLNNGTLGLCPDQVIDAQKRELELFELNTSKNLGSAYPRLWQIQNQLGAFVGAQAQNLFLRPNITLAINEIAMALRLPVGSEVLTTNFEYGAVLNILKLKCEREQLALRIGDVGFLYQDLSIDEIIASFKALIRPTTKLLVISHVFTGNGITIPLKELSRACQELNVLLLVDGAHAPGLIPLNIEKDYPDLAFYTGNLHKWVMGPKGTAFGWVHPQYQHLIEPCYGSWTTADNANPSMADFGSHHDFAARMLWSHSQAFSAYFALENCFQFWQSYGIDFILSQIKARRDYLEEGLCHLGLRPLKHSHILAYSLSDLPGAKFEGLLITNTSNKAQKPVQVGLPRVPGTPVFRLSPHIHNSELELAQALESFRIWQK